MLTPYDEFPVLQYSYPFSQIPASDFNWDDGYYFGVYNADAGIFLYTGMRVTPNADMIGCYAGVTVRGRQTTVSIDNVDYYRRLGALETVIYTHYAAVPLVSGDDLLARRAWVSTEVLFEAVQRMGRSAGIA